MLYCSGLVSCIIEDKQNNIYVVLGTGYLA